MYQWIDEGDEGSVGLPLSTQVKAAILVAKEAALMRKQMNVSSGELFLALIKDERSYVLRVLLALGLIPDELANRFRERLDAHYDRIAAEVKKRER